MKTTTLTLLGVVVVALFTGNQILSSFQKKTSLLSAPSFDARVGTAHFQSLGEDKDWDVKDWSKKHTSAVSSDRVDKISAKNIWHSKSEAWKGIDRIFPTGNDGYSYQLNHFMNGNQAKLVDYMKMVNTQLKGMGENIAKIGSKHLKHESAAKFSQEEKEVQDIIKSERQSISAVMHQTREETTTEDKALPMMLSQTTKGSKLSLQPTESIAPLPSVFEPPAVPAQQIPADAPDGMSTVGLGQPAKAKAAPVAAAARKGRVFADEAMYGEGIPGDIRRMGKAGAGWDDRAARSDMDKFFDGLPVQTVKSTPKA